jgi:hypothetical protein
MKLLSLQQISIIQAKQFNMNPVKADTFVPTDSDNLIT